MGQVMEWTADAGPSVDEVEALLRLRDVCDRMTVILRDEPLGRATEVRAETKLRLLARGLEGRIRRYRATHAGRTGESQVVSAGLVTVKEDLEWLRREHDTASPTAIVTRLRHALRATINVLTLLRWAWLGADGPRTLLQSERIGRRDWD